MAGGAGTRLWPWSNSRRPKHLLDLDGSGRTLLRQTYDRLLPLAERVTVVTEARQEELIRAEIPELGPADVIVEPVARGTANAYGLAALEIANRDPEAIMLCTPADQVIRGEGYADCVDRAARAAATTGDLVTIGRKPDRPATGYGYIRVEGEPGREGTLKVAEFVEKPAAEAAARYVADGRYYWNLAMFAWRAKDFLRELERWAPDHHGPLVAGADYGQLPNQAVDYAVLERTDRLQLVPATFEWLDVGAWPEVAALLPADGDGNAISGQAALIDTRNTFVSAPGKLVAAVGVEDLIVVDTEDVLLVVPRDRAQDVKRLVELLKSRDATRYL